jgi:hypothetical protein
LIRRILAMPTLSELDDRAKRLMRLDRRASSIAWALDQLAEEAQDRGEITTQAQRDALRAVARGLSETEDSEMDDGSAVVSGSSTGSYGVVAGTSAATTDASDVLGIDIAVGDRVAIAREDRQHTGVVRKVIMEPYGTWSVVPALIIAFDSGDTAVHTNMAAVVVLGVGEGRHDA